MSRSRRNARLALLLGSAALSAAAVLLAHLYTRNAQAWGGCPPTPCTSYTTGPSWENARIEFDGWAGYEDRTNGHMVIVVQDWNPEGSGSWSAADWASHLGIYAFQGSDYDPQTVYWYNESCQLQSSTNSQWTDHTWTGAWSWVGSSVDLTTPGEYVLKHTWTDQQAFTTCNGQQVEVGKVDSPVAKTITLFVFDAELTKPFEEWPNDMALEATFTPGAPPNTAPYGEMYRWEVVIGVVDSFTPYYGDWNSTLLEFHFDEPHGAPNNAKFTVWSDYGPFPLGPNYASQYTRAINWMFKVVSPVHDEGNPSSNNFVFNDQTPGVLEVEHQAILIPDDLAEDEDIVWTTDFAGPASLAFNPDDGSSPENGIGLNPTLTVTGLPPDNDQLGRKATTVVCTFKQVFGGSTQDTATYDVFFPTEESNWPNSTGEPNWYYYWSDTAASEGAHVYDASLADLGLATWGETVFKIGPGIVANPYPEIHVRHENRSLYTLSFTHAGIDLFARICLHELRHVEQWNEWQDAHGAGPPPGNPQASGDADWLWDSYEQNSGGNPITWDYTQFDTTDVQGLITEGQKEEFDRGFGDHEDSYVWGPDGSGLWTAGDDDGTGDADDEDWSDTGWQSDNF